VIIEASTGTSVRLEPRYLITRSRYGSRPDSP
jgi:hypothetical protein